MFDPLAGLVELQQPCLHRRIGDRLCGADGLVRREILSSLDRIFLERLAQARSAFRAPTSPLAISSAERFINVSALQKAIRRGDLTGAMRFAQQGCGLNAEQVFRRLATCAVEDVGIGNLVAVGMALAVMGNRTMRESGAPDELAAYLASTLASSSKSRLACDLLSIADYDRTLKSTKRRLARSATADRIAGAKDRSSSYPERMAAVWLAAGSAQFPGASMPRVSGDRKALLRLMVERRTPLIYYYIADRTASRLRDAMFVSWFLIAEIMDADPIIRISSPPLAKSRPINGYPANAYDLHTSEGRIALSRFAQQCAPVASCLAGLSPTSRETAVRHAVFIVEGGKLADRLNFDVGERISEQAHAAELKFAGLEEGCAQAQLLKAITENLHVLHSFRAQALP